MLSVTCSKCQRRLRIDDSARGKSVKCPCGELLTVSQENANANGSDPSVPPQRSEEKSAKPHYHQYACQCGRKLRVEMGHSERKSKCPCGNSFAVPAIQVTAIPSSSQPTKAANPIPVAKPVDIAPVWAAPSVPRSSYQVKNVPYAGTILPTVGAEQRSPASSLRENPSDVLASTYMAEAEHDSYRRDHNREESFFNGTFLGGILMMVGSVIWLVVGLQFDLLFYYPLFLFVFGLITCIKAVIA